MTTPVSDGISPAHAAIIEPTSIGARAVIRNSRVGAGDRVLVAGPGPIRLLTAQIADARVGEVVVAGVERAVNYRLPLAEELGFEMATIGADDGDLEAMREAQTDGIGYGVVFDTTGHPSGLPQSVDQGHKGGQMVLVGQTGETTMPYSPLVRSEVTSSALMCRCTAILNGRFG